MRSTLRTLDGRRCTYVLLAQDIFTRFAWAELLDARDQVPEMFQRILERANRSPTVLTTDEDTVFMGSRSQAMLRRNDIGHVLIPRGARDHRSPHRHGVPSPGHRRARRGR